MTRTPSQNRPSTGRARPTAWLWLATFAAFAAYLCSGFYVVRTDEAALLRRFGSLIDPHVRPGLHYRLPFGIERVDKLKVNESKRVTVGFGVPDQTLRRDGNPSLSQFVTGDANIMNVRVTVQYNIQDPVAYRLRVAEPAAALQRLAESVLAETVAQMTVDEVWQSGQERIIKEMETRTCQAVERYGLGLVVCSVNLLPVVPPREVAREFADVTSARQDQKRIVNEAWGYAREVVPRAEGEARALEEQALAYREKRQNEATGDTDRFLRMMGEYRKAKDLATARLYIEAMEEILPRLRIIVADSGGQSPVDLTLFESEE